MRDTYIGSVKKPVDKSYYEKYNSHCEEVYALSKMGRPKLEKIKDRIVTVRMSDEEYEKLKAYAESHKMTVTELIKKGVELVYYTLP